MVTNLKNLILKAVPLPKQVQPKGTLVVFQYLDRVCNAIESIKSRPDFSGFEVYSPTSYHEIEHACGYGFSPVRWLTLVCGLTGTLFAFALCMLTDLDWPLVVGGKTPAMYSLPAYIVIMFEMTILFGGIGTVVGMLFFCKLPNPKHAILDPRLTDDRFAIFLPNIKPESEQVSHLKNFGYEEVKAIDF